MLPVEQPPASPGPTSPRPPGVGFPVCTTGDFPIFSDVDPYYQIPMRQRLCVEQAANDSYRATLTLHEVAESSDDRVSATFRLELRECGTNQVLASRPAGGGTTTAGGGTPVLTASVGPVTQRVYAAVVVTTVRLTTSVEEGGPSVSPWSAPGLNQELPIACA